LDLSTGFPDPALLPDLTPYLAEAAERRRFRGYDSSPILPGLRDTLRRELALVTTRDEEFLLSTHVLGLLTEVLPVIGGYRARVVVNDPEFAPYLDLLERAAMVPVPIESDAEGLRLDLCEDAIDQGASAIILQPRVHNPTGVSMSPDRLRRLSLLCAERDVLIIDSDYFGGLSSSAPMSAARWAPDHTLYIRSYAKDLHPDIRVVAAVGSPRIIHPLRRRRVGGFDVSGINQELLRLMLDAPEARECTAKAKEVYDRRRSDFIRQLGAADIHVISRDGFNVWTPVRSELDALVHLASNGIAAAPGSAFQVNDREPHLRISIAGMGDDAVGIARLVSAAARARRMRG
jgi:DNA-binding transcriptional MocR family regulator